jgi:hypothetical protein
LERVLPVPACLRKTAAEAAFDPGPFAIWLKPYPDTNRDLPLLVKPCPPGTLLSFARLPGRGVRGYVTAFDPGPFAIWLKPYPDTETIVTAGVRQAQQPLCSQHVAGVFCRQKSCQTPIIPAHGWGLHPSIAMRTGKNGNGVPVHKRTTKICRPRRGLYHLQLARVPIGR